MYSNTKLIVIASLLIIVGGSTLLWFGLKPFASGQILPSPLPSVETIPTASSPALENVVDGRVLVTKVIDGDTINVKINDQIVTVRLLGIDTPETVDPRRPVGCFGKEASNEAKNLMANKYVILEKDVSETDKYGRLLRYVYLPLDSGQLLFINDYLVREGFALTLTYPPDVAFNEQFRQAERQAREGRRGLWGRC